jgi:L-amino acid N-acyltransferase YncA
MMDVAGTESVDAESRVTFVAEIAGEVVGSLVAGELSDGAWMILSVHTVEGARGVGVGDALMERFCDAAGERGARRLLSRALPGDRETKNLFERHGFTAQMIVLGSDVPSER